ncbi:hypothetical protein [Roseibium alexandrii]|uniref:Uncharacterized protein n=1 Tax=Roseibium alexandrii (strain DSM 17067 / NCIMB 14079 / DFL-11) TaxID=244592 RepID=A0A5E8H1E8_ROSAD|nr:hypothetical protein [Roseibium alexandrii]EEE45858.2 hypothetical protein SADFL11_3147 [Roseibium alexandrii DFL-11]
MSPSKGRIARLIDAIATEFQSHLIDLRNTSTSLEIRDGAVEKMISRQAPFGVIGLKILVSDPGDAGRYIEHAWNFSIGITGCVYTLLDVDYQNDVWIGDETSAGFAGHEHVAYKTAEQMMAFHGDEFGIGQLFTERVGALCPSLLEKPPLFFRLPRRAPPAYRYTLAPDHVRAALGLSTADPTILLEIMIKEHGIDPYTILLSFQSDTNFWLVDLPDTLADRYQHGLMGEDLGEHHANLEVGATITADTSRKTYRFASGSTAEETRDRSSYSMSGTVSARGYMTPWT